MADVFQKKGGGVANVGLLERTLSLLPRGTVNCNNSKKHDENITEDSGVAQLHRCGFPPITQLHFDDSCFLAVPVDPWETKNRPLLVAWIVSIVRVAEPFKVLGISCVDLSGVIKLAIFFGDQTMQA